MTAWNLTARQGLAMIVRAKKEFLTSCFAGGDPTCELNCSDPVPQQVVVTQTGLLILTLLELVT